MRDGSRVKSYLNGARHKLARAGGFQARGGVPVRLRAGLGGVRAMESREVVAVQAVGVEGGRLGRVWEEGEPVSILRSQAVGRGWGLSG